MKVIYLLLKDNPTQSLPCNRVRIKGILPLKLEYYFLKLKDLSNSKISENYNYYSRNQKIDKSLGPRSDPKTNG